METVTIKLATVNEVASYLATKPYREVAGLLAALNEDVTRSQQAQKAPMNGHVGAEPELVG